MRHQMLFSFTYGLLAVLFTLLAVGVEQWTVLGLGTVGLFGVVQPDGSFWSWQNWVPNHLDPKWIQYQTAGQVGAAFLIIGAVLLLSFTIIAFMKTFKDSINFPEHHKNNSTTSIWLSRIGIHLAIFGSLSVWFGWALWASLRVYEGGSGWSILFVVLGFVFGFLAAMMFSIGVSNEVSSYAVIPEHGHDDDDLHRDWSTPPYRTSIKSFLYYNQWDAPALTRTLFHLSLIVFTIYYLEFTTSFAIASPKDLWVNIIVGVLYWCVAAVISRIVCELVLAVFVAKDHFVGKHVRRAQRAVVAAAPAPSMDDQSAAAAQPPVVGGYQQL